MRKLVVVGVILALAACNSAPADDPAPAPTEAQGEPAAPAQEAPAADSEEPETVVMEVEPEIDTAAPMDSGAPMAEPMTTAEEFDPQPVEQPAE